MNRLASASLAFVALASPAVACDHLQSLGLSCAACNVASAPAHATSSTVYTQTVTQQLAPVIRYEVRPVLSDVVIPDPLPEVPEVQPVAPPVQPSCNASGAASGMSYSHSYSTHGAFSGGNAFSNGYNAYGSAHGYRAVQQRAIRNRNQAVHATATVRAVRNQDVQYGYGYDASAANGVQANGKVKALPRLRNAVGSLFGKP